MTLETPPASLTVLELPMHDPRVRPLLDELAVEYDSRYGDLFGRGAAAEELNRYPAEEFEAPHGALLILQENGGSVAGNVKIPCNLKHTWRAVTTIKVGLESDDYPGDRMVEVKTREFCSDSVGAWMNYPVDYDFAYTWFHEAEWEAGNRRSVCWAKTDQ